MNLEQVKTLIDILRDAYPNSQAFDRPSLAENWHTIMQSCNAKDMLNCVGKAIFEGELGDFPPNLNQIMKLYNSTQPQPPQCFEELSYESSFRKCLVLMAKKTYPDYPPKHQFGSQDEMQKSLQIRKDQQIKEMRSLFKNYSQRVWDLHRQGVRPIECLIRVLGAHNVPHLADKKALPDAARQALAIAGSSHD